MDSVRAAKVRKLSTCSIRSATTCAIWIRLWIHSVMRWQTSSSRKRSLGYLKETSGEFRWVYFGSVGLPQRTKLLPGHAPRTAPHRPETNAVNINKLIDCLIDADANTAWPLLVPFHFNNSNRVASRKSRYRLIFGESSRRLLSWIGQQRLHPLMNRSSLTPCIKIAATWLSTIE